MRILITGASGLLGRSLMTRLAPLIGAGGTLIGTAHSRARPPLTSIDLTDEAAVRAAFAAWTPDLVVHAAAERRPDVVEGNPQAAERLNVDATDLLARLAAGRGTRFIYISTDYVFDGTSPPYLPEDKPAPLNAYGRMKLAGEQAVRAAFASGGGWAIVRIPILYGRVESLSESPVTELAVKLLKGQPLKAEDWAARYPAHAEDVARAVAFVAARLIEGAGGLFHFAGAERLTKYGMALLIADALGLERKLIEPDPRPPAGAPRPKDCRLDGTGLATLGFTPRIAFRDGIREALEPFITAR